MFENIQVNDRVVESYIEGQYRVRKVIAVKKDTIVVEPRVKLGCAPEYNKSNGLLKAHAHLAPCYVAHIVPPTKLLEDLAGMQELIEDTKKHALKSISKLKSIVSRL
jgi:hypothetical protein